MKLEMLLTIGSVSSVIVGIVCAALLFHFNPVIGLAAAPAVLLGGLFGGWVLKPKAERVFTLDEIGNVVDERIKKILKG